MIVLMNTMKSGKKINLNGLSNVQQKIAMESWKNNPKVYIHSKAAIAYLGKAETKTRTRRV